MRSTKSVPGKKRFGLCTSPVCISNLSHPEGHFELLMFPGEFLVFLIFLIFPRWYCSDNLWSLASSRRDNQSCSWLLVWPTYTVLLTIFNLDHQFLFLIGWYSVAEIWCLIKKRNENDKNTIFRMRNNKKG